MPEPCQPSCMNGTFSRTQTKPPSLGQAGNNKQMGGLDFALAKLKAEHPGPQNRIRTYSGVKSTVPN